MMVVEQTQD